MRPHLLCVDDSEAILGLERAALGQHYVLSTAANGREALEKVRALAPACVLLDLSMPEMDGDQVLAHMRADPSLRAVPVIVITSETRRREKLLAAGAQAFVAKPVQVDELRAIVGQVLAEDAER